MILVCEKNLEKLTGFGHVNSHQFRLSEKMECLNFRVGCLDRKISIYRDLYSEDTNLSATFGMYARLAMNVGQGRTL